MEFEKNLERLENIVQKMEKGDLSLEDSLKLFEEGIKVSRECHLKLTEAEKKVQLMLGTDSAGNPITQDFIPQD